MALRNLRKTTEVVPSASSSLLNGNETFGQVERFVEKEDNSNFTVNKWRNKVIFKARLVNITFGYLNIAMLFSTDF